MIYRYLDLSNANGVSNILAGTSTLAEAGHTVCTEQHLFPSEPSDQQAIPEANERNSYHVPSGLLPPNPAELLRSQRMSGLIDDARRVSDHVIIDTAPLLVVSDSLSFVGSADAVILCALIGRTTIEGSNIGPQKWPGKTGQPLR